MSTPKGDQAVVPAEWTRHDACWVAWPSHGELWGDALAAAQAEWTAMAQTIADGGERLEVCVRSVGDEAAVRRALPGVDLRTHRLAYGDIWLRDTAPVFVTGPRGAGSVRFVFDGWDGKYVLPGDAQLAERIQRLAGGRPYQVPLVCEGGAVDTDGAGTLLTTRQCLERSNRNPGMTAVQVEQLLCTAYGARHVVWIDEGLANDHTDGHVDTLARFVQPGVVVCMAPSGDDDPNREVLTAIREQLEAATDAEGKPLRVMTVPSPGRVEDDDGKLMPASHVNAYIGNETVIVPVYGTAYDAAAVEAWEGLVPGRRVVGLPCRTILQGGGAFHCITQQVPAEVP